MSDTDYRFTVRPLSEDEGGGYLVEFPDLPRCMSDGETIEEAVANGEDAKRCWLAAMKEAGRPIPPPSVEPAEGYSGKWQLRAPKSLHRRLVERAKREGVSLNTLAVTLLAEGLGERSAMATETPESEPADNLPEKIGPADLEALNQSLEALFGELRFARGRPPGETHGRLGAVIALRAVWTFLMRFERVLAETLHVPLLNLQGALLALNQNNVEPLLKPTIAPDGGRAPDSPAREQLIGFAAGAVGRLQWTGMPRVAAHKVVADILNKLGFRPGRGSGRITARTVRGWCEHVAADVGGHSIAATNANAMLTNEWQAKVRALPQTGGRKFVLDALANVVRNLMNGAVAPVKKPSNPPS